MRLGPAERQCSVSIFVTAHSDAQKQARAREVCALDLLSKPVSAAAVAAALRRAAQIH